MLMSKLLLRTLRDAPGDAEAISHQLLVRAGYIRRHASGIYTYLPLGWRLLRNVERVVREEMDAAGAQEMLMPILQSTEVWEQTGRLKTMEDILFRLEGKGGELVLGPTHEEVVTATVGAEVDSYRDLPLNVYQIQFKYRDEARPRFGLMRGREFIMKDAYSFDASPAGMQAAYATMYAAYERVFERCGLSVTPVEAESGAIGGEVNHEFMVTSPIGEDHFVRCPNGDYAANTEAAVAGERRYEGDAPEEELIEHHTPDSPSIELLVQHFTAAGRPVDAESTLKCVALLEEETGRPVIVLVPGDREARPPKGTRPFEQADFDAHPELIKGYIGPMGLQKLGIRVLADRTVGAPRTWVTGANRADHHVSGATLGRDFEVDTFGSFAMVTAGDPCPRCGEPVELVRSVEAGHTFQLGLTYSTKIDGATFLAEDSTEQPFWMGCYGIGISRLPAVVAEQHHDDAGLIWPDELAPFAVHLLSLGAGRNPDVAATADRIYAELTSAGLSVLYDDRDQSPGVKFADADLLGMPTQLLVGAKGLAKGTVERKRRRTGERDDLPLDGVVAALTTP